MDLYNVITIDGPAASGKSSVSRDVAKRLGWKWVSTGAFYRLAAVVAKKVGVIDQDETAIISALKKSSWRVELDHQRTRAFFNNEEITDEIYLEATGSIASKISQYPQVRAFLLDHQRNCLTGVAGLVAEGRDCGTVVFPTAPWKFFLTANADDRARRRAMEQGQSVDATLVAQKERDKMDASRATAPMQVPAGAVVLDTSSMTLSEVTEWILDKLKSS